MQGKIIKQYRRIKRITKQEFAEMLGVTRPLISMLENDQIKLRGESAVILNNLLQAEGIRIERTKPRKVRLFPNASNVKRGNAIVDEYVLHENNLVQYQNFNARILPEGKFKYSIRLTNMITMFYLTGYYEDQAVWMQDIQIIADRLQSFNPKAMIANEKN